MASDPDDEPDSNDVGDEISSDERTWAIIAHASALVGFIVPFGNILGPVLVWAIKKEDSQFIDENGKAAINFQITWTILIILVGLTILVGIGVFLVPIVGIAWVILVVIAILRTSNDQVYHYPLTIDLIS
jgi:uncharacterized Tic20 family protein